MRALIICLLLHISFTTALFGQGLAKNAGKENNSGPLIHYIGELYGGGFVVAAWKTNGIEHGLIVSPEELTQSTIWGNDTALIGPSAQSLTDGQANTLAILAHPGYNTGAAKLCHQYKGGGYTDWYLPSISELRLFFSTMNLVSYRLGLIHLQSSRYWTSTEYNDENKAYNLNITQFWGVDWVSKNNTYGVLAFRKY